MKKVMCYFLSLWMCMALVPLFISFVFVKTEVDVNDYSEVASQEKKEKGTVDESTTVSVYVAEEKKTKEMTMEKYLISVVGAEMPANFELEALKAQAVAARSYTVNRMNENAKNDNLYKEAHDGADVCTDYTHCKAFLSPQHMKENFGKNYDIYYEKLSKSVCETDGEIAVYNDEAICAVFHSTSGGKTENAKDVWGNEVPYLQSVESEGEEASPRYLSENVFTIEEFKSRMTLAVPNITFSGDAASFVGAVTRSEAGGVETIELCGTALKGSKVREIFNLRSSNFDVIATPDEVQFTVHGYGHGVGLSQYGANYMAQKGSRYDEIVKWYYTGITLEKMTV